MKILMVGPTNKLYGPIFEIMQNLRESFLEIGIDVEISNWGKNKDENIFHKLINRKKDFDLIKQRIKDEDFSYIFFNESHSFYGLIRQIPVIRWIKKNKINTVYLFHGTRDVELFAKKYILFRILFSRIIFSSKAVFCLSKSYKENLEVAFPNVNAFHVRLPFDIQKRIGNNHSHEKIKGSESKGNEIVFVGRLIKEKGIIDLIHAFSLYNKENPEAKLKIIGAGKEYKKIISVIKNLNLGKSIILVGKISPDEVIEHIDGVRCLVLPSFREGFPVVVLEALSLGIPIISTKVGGIPDFLVEGDNALFVEYKNILQIQVAIKKIFEEELLFEKISRNNKLLSREFSFKDVAEDYSKFFNKSLDGNQNEA